MQDIPKENTKKDKIKFALLLIFFLNKKMARIIAWKPPSLSNKSINYLFFIKHIKNCEHWDLKKYKRAYCWSVKYGLKIWNLRFLMQVVSFKVTNYKVSLEIFPYPQEYLSRSKYDLWWLTILKEDYWIQSQSLKGYTRKVNEI